MLGSGVYRIFHISTNSNQPVERYAGRFMIDGKEFHILEDLHNLFDDISTGEMNPDHNKLLHNLIHSGYFRLINEENINLGQHNHLIPEMDIGPTVPDEEYLLYGDSMPEPKKVEVFGSSMCIDGKRLGDEEMRSLRSQINNGLLTLTPI